MTAKSSVDSVKNTEEKPEEQIIKDIGKLKQDKGKTCDPLRWPIEDTVPTFLYSAIKKQFIPR